MKLLTRTKRTANDGDLVVRYRPPFTLDAEPSLGPGQGIDLYAVERALAGEHPQVCLTETEARVAWSLIANEQELWASEIAELLGVSDRTVVRWRTARRTGAASHPPAATAPIGDPR